MEEAGPDHNVLAGFQKPILHTELPCSALLNTTGDTQSSLNLICHALFISLGGLPFSEQKQRGGGGVRGSWTEEMGGGKCS